MKKLFLLTAIAMAIFTTSAPPPEQHAAPPQNIAAQGSYDKIQAAPATEVIMSARIAAITTDIVSIAEIKQAGRSTDTKIATGVISFDSQTSAIADAKFSLVAGIFGHNQERASSAEPAQGGAPPVIIGFATILAAVT